MTKKHFEEAASIVKNETDKRHKQAVFEAFVTLFKRAGNPRFDVERFRTACGL